MKNLKFSFVVLALALVAVNFAWSSVILEETVSAPVDVSDAAAVVVEEDEKQGGESGKPKPKCPGSNCYQTSRCKHCKGNTDPGECCDNGGLGDLCDNYCRALHNNNWTGRGVGCYCWCYRE